MPQEIEVWYVLPALRKAIALELKTQGLTQTKVASLLHVTKAAITQYLKNNRAQNIELTPIESDIKAAALRLKNGESHVSVLNTLLARVRETKLICAVHKAQGSEDLNNCEACFTK